MEEQEPAFDFVQRVEAETRPTDEELFGMMCERLSLPSATVLAGIRAAGISANEARNAGLFMANVIRKLNRQ